MAGLNARGLQSKLLITPLVSEAIIIIIILQNNRLCRRAQSLKPNENCYRVP